MHFVGRGWYRLQGERPIWLRQAEVRGGEGDYDGAHFRVDVAEDIRDAVVIKMHDARGSSFIQAKIESLAVEQRKHVMEKGIKVREIHAAARGDDEEMRRKLFSLLRQPIVPWLCR